jgi:hypothetical protein
MSFPAKGSGVTALIVVCAGFVAAIGSAAPASAGVMPAPPSALQFGGDNLALSPPKPPLYTSTGALTFNFNPVGNLADMLAGNQGGAQQTLGQQVVDGFATAGDRWSAIFNDNIQLNIDINFGPLGNGVLGGTTAQSAVVSYNTVRTGLINDAKSFYDTVATANLQPTGSLDFLTNQRSGGTVIRSNSADTYTKFLDVNRANLKAIDVIAANDAGLDANITFTDFTDYGAPYPAPPNIGWDFDPGDGITANRIDFVGVATHEIGHALGFTSGVDTMDYVSDPSGPAKPPTDLNGGSPGTPDISTFAVFSVLDFFRYSSASLAEGSQPASGAVLDLAYGGTPYFSIDAGATNLATYATGSYNGDGRQASHWKDNLGLGIMDPTTGLGELTAITPLDIRAIDVIGYDLVPEPGSLAVFLVGVLLIASRPRRQRS